MLARTPKTAADLGLTEAHHAALVKVADMLERGMIEHRDGYLPVSALGCFADKPPVGFNMIFWRAKSDCGTVACIGGWAEYLGGDGIILSTAKNRALNELFAPDLFGVMVRYRDITPAQAAAATRNFLDTGRARWEEVLRG